MHPDDRREGMCPDWCPTCERLGNFLRDTGDRDVLACIPCGIIWGDPPWLTPTEVER